MAAPARRLTSQTLQLPLAVPARPVLVPPPPPVEPGQSDAIRQLRASINTGLATKAQVTSAAELLRALENRRREDLLPTTIAGFDALLGGGLPRGKVVELTGRRSSGRFSIVMSALATSTSLGEAATLVDLGDNFDPQLGEANGIDLRRMLWIRPHTIKQAVMAVEMIAATGFQLVILDAGSHPIRGRRVPDAAWVRLARTAEAHGTAMLISTPYALTGTASEAHVAAHTGRAKWLGLPNGPRVLAGIDVTVTLDKHRHLRPGRSERLSFRTIESCLA